MLKADITNKISGVMKLFALALAASAAFLAGSAQAATFTNTYNLGTQASPTTIQAGVGGLLPWIPKGTLPAGSILKSVSVNAIIEGVGSDAATDDWASDICAYIDPFPEAPGAAATLQVGGYGTIGNVNLALTDTGGGGWANGQGGPPTRVNDTKTAADWSAVGDIDLSTVQLSVGNDYSEASWSGTISVVYYGPASITSFGPGAVIDDAAKTITWTLPYGTTTEQIAALAPTITVSTGTCDPPSGTAPNFTVNNPVTYTVIDGTITNTYVVTVTVSSWGYSAWKDDTDSGITSASDYTVAVNCNGAAVTVNGVAFEAHALSGANFSIGGDVATFGGGNPNITGDSLTLASTFIYGGSPRTVTLKNLTPMATYETSFFAYGFEAAGRIQTFTSGSDSYVLDQDLYGQNNGIRISSTFVADPSGSKELTITPVNPGNTFHMSALANRKVSDPPPATILNFGTNVIASSAVFGLPVGGVAAIAWTVPYGTVLSTLAPTLTLSSGTCSPPSGTVRDFSAGPVACTVTDGGTINTYTVTVTVEPPRTACDITAFNANVTGSSAVIDSAAGTVVVVVPAGTDVAALAPTYTLSLLATCNQPNSAKPTPALSLTTPVHYIVTAGDGVTTKDYTVTVVASLAPPAGVPNLALWLDAAQLTGLASGATVSTWLDHSGTGNHAVRINGTPTYQTSVIDGQPVVRFYSDASIGDYLRFPRIDTIRTVFWVLKEDVDHTTARSLFLLGDSDTYNFHRGGDNLWAAGAASARVTGGTTRLMGRVVNGTTTALPRGSFQVVSLVTTDNVQANQITQDRIYHGSWKGDIAEVLIYTRELTSEEEAAVGRYLTTKYALATDYAPAKITSFGANVTGSTANIGQPVANAAAITWTVPSGTVLATLAPTYTLSSGTCPQPNDGSTPPTPVFPGPVTYTVTDGATINTYTVTVVVEGLIKPTAATAQSYYAPDDRAPVHAIDGSGMTPNSPVTTSSTCGTGPGGNMWVSDGTKETWITFDLGSEQTIAGFHLWNYNENSSPGEYQRGVRTAGIYKGTSLLADGADYYAQAGPAWGTLVEEMTFTMAPGTAGYAGEDYLFSAPVTTRYIQIYATSNFGFDAYTGISEIRFIPRATMLSFGANLAGSSAVIDQTGRAIAWTVPYGTLVTNLKPSYTLSSGTCDKDNGGPTGYDFSSPVTYTVTDPGIATNIYIVTVTVMIPAEVAVGASGSGTLTFGTLPPPSQWSTLSWTGSSSTVGDVGGLDAAVQLLTAGDISTTLGQSATWTPSVNALARHNTTQLLLQTRPTGVLGCALMATLRNTTGGGINSLTISYDFGKPSTGAEDVPGLRAYYSLTGLANSWTPIPELSTATPGALTATVGLSSTWPDAALMYVLWVDDNAIGDDDANTLDNVSFAPPPPVLGFTSNPDGTFTLTWTSGTLLEADSVTGTWTTNTTVISGVPITPSKTVPQRYYRLQVP